MHHDLLAVVDDVEPDHAPTLLRRRDRVVPLTLVVPGQAIAIVFKAILFGIRWQVFDDLLDGVFRFAAPTEHPHE